MGTQPNNGHKLPSTSLVLFKDAPVLSRNSGKMLGISHFFFGSSSFFIFFLNICVLLRNYEIFAGITDWNSKVLSEHLGVLPGNFRMLFLLELSRPFPILSRKFQVFSRNHRVISRNIYMLSWDCRALSGNFPVLSRNFPLLSRNYQLLSRHC